MSDRHEQQKQERTHRQPRGKGEMNNSKERRVWRDIDLEKDIIMTWTACAGPSNPK